MKGIFLVRNGDVDKAFEIKETDTPSPGEGEVLIKNHAFGLNFADVLARKGLYPDAPPNPALLGYEAVGEVAEVGNGVTGLEKGQRVLAFTKFGAYAEYTVTNALGVIPIEEDISNGEAVALATQYCTAYYAAYDLVHLREGQLVLVHASAGGVGTALIQLAKAKGCTVVGTAGSDEKLKYAQEKGADFTINYRTQDFIETVKDKYGDRRLDVIFDPIGGKTFKKGINWLNYGGKIVLFGAASRSQGGIFSGLKLLFGFGFYSPIKFLIKSQSLIGLNMLRIAEHHPQIINDCLRNVYQLYQDGVVNPHVGASFKANEIGTAHALLESRKSKGKIVVEW